MQPPVRKTKKSQTTPAEARTQGLLVLGMHRSGTSAVTRVLNLLGCALPDDLIGPSESNETGHWESVAAMQLNDAILASAGSNWADWGAINDDWHQSGLKAEMLGRISQVIQDHAALGPLFALKDPRTCRVADLWLAGMAEAKVEARVLLMLRNPAEVCASLEERDLMAPGYGQLLWLRHVLDAEFYSRGVQRVVCHYDHLMRNWQGEVDRIKTGLGIALPRNTPAVHAEIDQYLKGDYRHHERSADAVLGDLGQSAWLRRTFAIMMAWSQQGENQADHAELDRIRHELGQAYAIFARLLLRTDVSGAFDTGSHLKRELREQLAAARQAAEAAQQAVQDTEARQTAITNREAELQARLEASHAQTEQLQTEINALRGEMDRTAHIAAEANALRAREAELAAQLDGESVRVQQMHAEIDALRGEAERAAQLAAEADALRAHQEQLAQDVAQLDAALQAARTTVEQERQQRLAADRTLATQIGRLHDQEVRNAELAGRAATAESALVQRQEELSQLWGQLLVSEKAVAVAETQAAQERERRQDGERRLAASEAGAAELRAQLDALRAAPAPVPDHLIGEIAQLTRLLQEQEAATRAAVQALSGAEAALAARSNETAQLTRLLQEQEAATHAAMHALSGAEAALAARSNETAQLTRLLQEQQALSLGATAAKDAAERALARQAEESSQLQARLQQQESAARAAEAMRVQSEQKLDARFAEIAKLTSMLADASTQSAASGINAEWLRSMMQIAASFPRWWALMPQDWRRKREHARYRSSGLFDAARYLEAYPDVADNGMDPIRHYILHGMLEGRDRPK